jgi:cell division transport system permease protein
MLGAVLFLPLAFFLVFQNVMTLQQGFDTQPTASVFLRADQPADELAMRLRQRAGVVDVRIIHKNEGLEQLRQASGFSAEWLTSLDHNPLPDVVLLTLDTALIRDLELFREQLAAMPEVEHVTLDVIWLQRLGWLVTLLQRIAGLLTVALGLVVVLTIANTIRLTVENARTEIQVGWLVGASQGFLRRPFLYMGALYGFFGAIAALLLVAIAAWWLREPAQSLLASYTPNTMSLPMVAEIVLALVVVSMLLGWIGAGLAVRSVLTKMLPEAS